MTYNPTNYMNPNAELRKYNGEYYMYTPTKTQDIGGGAAGIGGTVEKIADPLALGYTPHDLSNNVYNATISPEAWVAAAKYTADEIKSNVNQTFSGFDPSNKTGWQSQMDTLVKQATDLYNADPTQQDKVFGTVWNNFRNNPANAAGIQTIQAENNKPRPEFTSQEQAGVYGQTGKMTTVDERAAMAGGQPAALPAQPYSKAIDLAARKGDTTTVTPPDVIPPAPAGGTTYPVKAGDTLSAIARQFKTTVDAIMAANPNITNRNLIYPNQKIIIPALGSNVDNTQALNEAQAKLTADLNKTKDSKNSYGADTAITKDDTAKTGGTNDLTFKMPSSTDLYNSLINSSEIKDMNNKLIDYKKQLDLIDAQELAMETDIRNQVQGEAPESLIMAMAAEKARALYPKKLALQAEATAVQSQLNQAMDNAKYQFTLKLQDQQNGLAYLDTVISAGTKLTAEQYKLADDALGYGAGWTKMYVQAKTKSENLTTQKDQLDLMDKILSLQAKLPAGQSFEFNGATYTAVTDPNKDIQIFNETDKATGKTIIIEYNKKTRQVTVTNTGVKTANPGGGDGTPKAGDYFTKPKADGSIGYYFGDEKYPTKAQELSKENYLQGVSKSAGVLDPNTMTSAEIVTSGKNWISNKLSSGAAVATIKTELYDKYSADLTPEELKTIVDYLTAQGKTRDAGKWKAGDYVGPG